MSRFKVGDRVMYRNREHVILGGPDPDGGWAIQSDEGKFNVVWGGAAASMTPVPPPNPRDALVESAVAYIDAYWPDGTRPAQPLTSALYDAVQAYKDDGR